MGVAAYHLHAVTAHPHKFPVELSGFAFSGEPLSRADDDVAVHTDDATLLIDPLSLQYLMGSEVDYTESLQGAQFVIRNPNATTTCGCGSSFSA